MVRYPITAPQSQERPQRKRVRAAPLQTALAVDALEVAHQVHPEIAPGRHRGRAHPGRVIRPAAHLGKGVEAALDQHRLQAVINDDPPHRRIAPQPVGVVHVLISGETSIDGLTQQSDNVVPAVLARPAVSQDIARQGGEAKGTIEFPIGEQTGVRRDP